MLLVWDITNNFNLYRHYLNLCGLESGTVLWFSFVRDWIEIKKGTLLKIPLVLGSSNSVVTLYPCLVSHKTNVEVFCFGSLFDCLFCFSIKLSTRQSISLDFCLSHIYCFVNKEFLRRLCSREKSQKWLVLLWIVCKCQRTQYCCLDREPWRKLSKHHLEKSLNDSLKHLLNRS